MDGEVGHRICDMEHCLLQASACLVAFLHCCTGVGLAVVDEEDMEPLGAQNLFDASYCAELLTHTTSIEKTHRPPSRSPPLVELTSALIAVP